jgi:hypothetical protein
MALARDASFRTDQDTLRRRASLIRSALIRDGLFDPLAAAESAERSSSDRWRIAPEPFFLSDDERNCLQSLGPRLLAFYRALNHLYLESLRGAQPTWVAQYLDQGKPESLVAYSRMKRFRHDVPAIIRPDIIPTEAGMVITELDAVPGGIGLTGSLSRAYAALTLPGVELIGGADGMADGFATMLREAHGSRPGEFACAIVVSDEAKDYRPEMQWLAAALREKGMKVSCVEPSDVRFTEDGLLLASSDSPTLESRISVLYRFFELFDLKNVPKAELIMYAAKKDLVTVTPPFKPQLEEKLAFALLHHPRLMPFWWDQLGEDSFLVLSSMVPRTWILDPAPVPPSAVIPGLTLARSPLTDWRELSKAGQKERRYVLKPSGFSELAWGSRGVSVGHDLPQTEWATALDGALSAFPTTPYVLQEFHKGRQFELTFHDPSTDELVPMAGRTRLSPFYFVAGDRTELGGVLATVCPLDKKVIHGMRDAVMAPCAVRK